MSAARCFEMTVDAERTVKLLNAMLREERKRERLRCQEACASVLGGYLLDEPDLRRAVERAIGRCVEAIMALED